MDFEYNKMSLHSDLVELGEKYEDTLKPEMTGHTMVQYGTEYMLDRTVSQGIAMWTAYQAVADAFKNHLK